MNMHRSTGFIWAFPIRLTVAALVAFSVLSARSVSAEERDRERSPGYVDGSVFLEFAGEDDELIEVSLNGPLLKVLGKAFTQQDPDLAKLVGQLDSISAVVIESDGKMDMRRASELIKKLTRRLEDRGWERLARIREKDSRIIVMALHDGEVIQGLTVLVVEGDGELVFANIAGRIDLAQIGKLGAGFGFPGLDAIPADAIRRSKGTSVERRTVRRRHRVADDDADSDDDDDDDDDDDSEDWWKS